MKLTMDETANEIFKLIIPIAKRNGFRISNLQLEKIEELKVKKE